MAKLNVLIGYQVSWQPITIGQRSPVNPKAIKRLCHPQPRQYFNMYFRTVSLACLSLLALARAQEAVGEVPNQQEAELAAMFERLVKEGVVNQSNDEHHSRSFTGEVDSKWTSDSDFFNTDDDQL